MDKNELKQAIKEAILELLQEGKIYSIFRSLISLVVSELQRLGLLSKGKTAVQKTEELLRQYPQLRGVQEPHAQRVVQEIDKLLAEAESEPYVDVIRLYYFGGLTNEGCANTLCCDERTCRRYRKKLVQQFSVRLASDEFIRELLT